MPIIIIDITLIWDAFHYCRHYFHLLHFITSFFVFVWLPICRYFWFPHRIFTALVVSDTTRLFAFWLRLYTILQINLIFELLVDDAYAITLPYFACHYLLSFDSWFIFWYITFFFRYFFIFHLFHLLNSCCICHYLLAIAMLVFASHADAIYGLFITLILFTFSFIYDYFSAIIDLSLITLRLHFVSLRFRRQILDFRAAILSLFIFAYFRQRFHFRCLAMMPSLIHMHYFDAAISPFFFYLMLYAIYFAALRLMTLRHFATFRSPSSVFISQFHLLSLHLERALLMLMMLLLSMLHCRFSALYRHAATSLLFWYFIFAGG